MKVTIELTIEEMPNGNVECVVKMSPDPKVPGNMTPKEHFFAGHVNGLLQAGLVKIGEMISPDCKAISTRGNPAQS